MFTTHDVSHVTCQVSRVRCHVSGVKCHMSGVRCNYLFFLFTLFFFFVEKVVELIGGGSGLNVAYPVQFQLPYKDFFGDMHLNPLPKNILFSSCKNNPATNIKKQQIKDNGKHRIYSQSLMILVFLTLHILAFLSISKFLTWLGITKYVTKLQLWS